MTGRLGTQFIVATMVASSTFAAQAKTTMDATLNLPDYKAIQKRLQSGWNTHDSRSVLRQVLLPEGFCINLAFKQVYWLEEKYLATALVGRYGEGAEKVRPGIHALDGSFTELEITWEKLHARVETARTGDDLVALITPLEKPSQPVKLVVETAMLWNRPGRLEKRGASLVAILPSREVRVFCTAPHQGDDPYVDTKTPFLLVNLDAPIGLSTGQARTVEDIRKVIEEKRAAVLKQAQTFKDLAEVALAVESGLAWNTIYEPKLNRIVSTVGRLWNEEYGGYCTFGWDNFFLSYMSSLFSRDYAYANVIEHLRDKTAEGFIPNDSRGNGSKSFDRSQPPVGSIMVREIYKRYPEKWFLAATFDDLLTWNRWWINRRTNGKLLSYGSHPAPNPFFEPSVQTDKTARYESGMDDSPMYQGVPFNKEKSTLELQDVGLNSLFIADCRALADMATVLGRIAERDELLARASTLESAMQTLWDETTGLYLNRRTDTGELSHRLSPTMFYPLLAHLPDAKRAQRMIDAHLFNPVEFAGDFILPSIARNDVDFPKQRYWKGAIWPPLNFLVYLGLRNYGFENAHAELAEKSRTLFMKEWQRSGFVSENYSSISGTGDDARLSSDRFHSWGALMGIMVFIEKGYLPAPEKGLQP